MISKNPKPYMNRLAGGPAFAKVQPINSVIFTELPTTQQKQQQYVSDSKSNIVSNVPSSQRGTDLKT